MILLVDLLPVELLELFECAVSFDQLSFAGLLEHLLPAAHDSIQRLGISFASAVQNPSI